MIDLDAIETETVTGSRYRGRAVVKGEIQYFSPTSLGRGDPLSDGGCPIKYYRRYVEGDKALEQDTIASAAGTELHAQNAAYLRTGVRGELGDLAMTGVHLLPDPAQVRAGLVNVETPIDPGPLRCAGVPVIGNIDVENLTGENRGGTEIEEIQDPPGTVEVQDHKTTGDRPNRPAFRKTGQDLIKTIQMPAYGVHEVLLRNAPNVRLSHNYYFTKQNRAAEKATKLYPAESLLRRWEDVDALGRALKDIAREPSVDKIDGNLAACAAFGGCPYRPTCDYAARNALRVLYEIDDYDTTPPTLTKGMNMGLLDDIFDAPATDTAPAPSAPPPSPLRAAWDYICDAKDADGRSVGLPELEGAAAVAIKELYGIKFGPSGKVGKVKLATFDDVVNFAARLREKLSPAPDADMPALTPPAPTNTATAPAPAAPSPVASETTPAPGAGVAPAVPGVPAEFAKKRGRPAKAKPTPAIDPQTERPIDEQGALIEAADAKREISEAAARSIMSSGTAISLPAPVSVTFTGADFGEIRDQMRAALGLAS